jgi:hypothetical protein
LDKKIQGRHKLFAVKTSMNIEKLPIWTAYIVAPLFLLAIMLKVIWTSDNTWLLVSFALISGLVCAAILHAYIRLKSFLFPPQRNEYEQT